MTHSRPSAALSAASRWSLRRKLIALTLAVTAITLLTMFTIVFLQIRAQDRMAARDRMDAAAQLHAQAIRTVFDQMTTDAGTLSRMPPVQGLIRTSAVPGGRDPADGSTSAHWQHRLQAIFAAYLDSRPWYAQVRYIGLADGGRELVRVDRDTDGPRVIPSDGLQKKGDEPYMQPLAAMRDGQIPPRAYFSDVTYNRERGQRDGPPMIRLVRPVTDAGGQVFGAVVINAGFGQMLRAAHPRIGAGFRVTVLTDALDSLSFDDHGNSSPLVFHSDPGWTPPLQAAALQARGLRAGPDGVILAGDVALRAIRVLEPGPGRPFGLSVVTEMPRTLLFAASARVLRQTAIAALLLSVAATAGAVIAARRITRPLRQLTRMLSSTRGAGPPIPADRDEIEALIAAVSPLADDLVTETTRSRAIFSSVADGIVVIDSKGRIEEANRAVEELFGYRTDELIGKGVDILMPRGVARHHQDYVDAGAPDFSPRPMSENRDIFGRRKDGSEVPLEISVSRAEYSGQVHHIGVLRDISARRQAEARVAALIEALQRSNEELDKFAHVASHDLKAPLRVIDNASRWLEEDLEPHLTEDTRETLGMLRSRVARMDRLLNDLLQHSRIGRQTEVPPIVTGRALVDDIRALVPMPPGFTFEIDPAVLSLQMPRMPMLTILLNLVSNALKHHDRSTGRIRLSGRDGPDGITVSVTDDGPGIPPAYHRQVFEMFKTLRPRDEVEGSGMGLAIVKKHVQYAGGRIELDSPGGRGTTIRVTLPHVAGTQTTGAAA